MKKSKVKNKKKMMMMKMVMRLNSMRALHMKTWLSLSRSLARENSREDFKRRKSENATT